MRIVKSQSDFAEWLKTASPSPVKVSEKELKWMNEAARQIIDPCRINQFVDAATVKPRGGAKHE